MMVKSRDHINIDYSLILRGCAAIGVILSHCFGVGSYSVGTIISGGPGVFAPITAPLSGAFKALYILVPLWGSNFVVLFFVLSGFLMGKIFHSRRYTVEYESIVKFYHNRYFRLAPLLYFNLIICVGLFAHADLSLKKLVGDIFFITNFTDRGVNLVTWSLAHEMQYYIIAPFVFFIFRKNDYRNLFLSVSACFFVYLITRSGLLFHFGYTYMFFAGYSINILLHLKPIHFSEKMKIAILVVGLIALNSLFNWITITTYSGWAERLAVLISAMLVYVAECPCTFEVTNRNPTAAAIARFGVFTGELTFGLYLWHYVLVVERAPLFAELTDSLVRHLGVSGMAIKSLLFHIVQFSIVFAWSYLVAWATFLFIERQFRPGLYDREVHASGPTEHLAR